MSGGWYDCDPEETALAAVGSYIASMPLSDQEQELTGERDRARDFAQRVEAENAQLIEQIAAATARAGTVEQELAAANRIIEGTIQQLITSVEPPGVRVLAALTILRGMPLDGGL